MSVRRVLQNVQREVGPQEIVLLLGFALVSAGIAVLTSLAWAAVVLGVLCLVLAWPRRPSNPAPPRRSH